MLARTTTTGDGKDQSDIKGIHLGIPTAHVRPRPLNPRRKAADRPQPAVWAEVVVDDIQEDREPAFAGTI